MRRERPTLILRPAEREPVSIGLLWVHGGGLCAAVCMMARDRGIRVAYQFPLYPMLSSLDTESSRDNHRRIWNTRRNHLGWRLYPRGDAKKETVSPYASPSWQTEESLHQSPVAGRGGSRHPRRRGGNLKSLPGRAGSCGFARIDGHD